MNAQVHEQKWNDFAVGDSVYCLAWIGKKFDISSKSDDVIALQADAEFDPYGAQVDITPKTLWMITHEPWDQLWYWPDRANESYEDVFNRFAGSLKLGQIINGYYFRGAMLEANIDVHPSHGMAFRVAAIDTVTREIQVQPVVGLLENGDATADVNDARTVRRWVNAGPAMSVTIGMHKYRWCLSIGHVVLNWKDFLGPDEAW